ncbi:MAG: HAD family hydrolase [Silvibacterium sp.]|nr:HAD family hydrolase [Silvibacterium sp.]
MGTDKSFARRAVFLDRDGVINRNVFNPATGEYEAPLTPAGFLFVPGALEALRSIHNAGFLLFLVSNQPNYAKGKSTLEDLSAIHEKLVEGLAVNGIAFASFYYCFHHPNGTGNRYSGACACRKPSPYFLLKAREEFSLDLSRSWMIGDRLTDIECGSRAGAKAIFIACESACSLTGPEPDAVAPDLLAAAGMILAAN